MDMCFGSSVGDCFFFTTYFRFGWRDGATIRDSLSMPFLLGNGKLHPDKTEAPAHSEHQHGFSIITAHLLIYMGLAPHIKRNWDALL
jgi:hypothetical protein